MPWSWLNCICYIMLRLRKISSTHNTLKCAILRFAWNYCLNCFPYHALRGAARLDWQVEARGCLDCWRRGPSLELGLKFWSNENTCNEFWIFTQAWEWEACYDLLSTSVLCPSLNWAFLSGRPLRPVILYTSVLYVPVLACADIGQEARPGLFRFSHLVCLFR